MVLFSHLDLTRFHGFDDWRLNIDSNDPVRRFQKKIEGPQWSLKTPKRFANSVEP
jgi:hypothetical protein